MEHDDWKQRMAQEQASLREKYKRLNRFAQKGQIVFAGSSLMEHFPVNELAASMGVQSIVYNRGIGGYTTSDFLESIELCVFELAPRKLFLNIGTNDIGAGDFDGLRENYREIVRRIRVRLPETKLYLLAYYPCNPKADFGLPQQVHGYLFAHRTNEAILRCNDFVAQLAEECGAQYLTVNECLLGGDGCLRQELSVEGVHLWPDAYALILERLRPYLD